MKNPWENLPPSVERHVKRQLETVDWDTPLKQLRSVCADCPAREMDDDEICLACPFEGVASAAATLSMKSKLAKLECKSQKRKIAKTTINMGEE